MLLVRDGRVRDIVRGGAPGLRAPGRVGRVPEARGRAARAPRDAPRRARSPPATRASSTRRSIPTLLARVDVGFERVDGLPWTEIDFPEDVVRAEREILPRLEASR